MPTLYSTVYSGYTWCARKSRRLVALWLVPLFDDYDSTNFLKIDSLCGVCLCTNAFSFQPFAFVGALLVHDRLGPANGSHFGYLWMIPSKRPMSRIGSSKFLILLIFSFPKIRDVVGIRRIAADFRDAFERIQTSSTRDSGVNKFLTSQSPLQRRLGVYSWNPGPRRGREGAIEKQIAGKWHLITLQEASEYVDHAILHERFYVTHFAGCAVLFNHHTFYPNVDVKSIFLHDTRRVLHDHIVEGEHGWVLQGVVSLASFRRAAASGETVFTVLSLHINKCPRQEKRYCQENHPGRLFSYDLSRH